MFSLTLYNEKLCLATSQVMDKGSACSVSLTSGVFSGACSVSPGQIVNGHQIYCWLRTKIKYR